MEIKYNIKMKQLIFQFPFKTTYFEKDFYVSSNNFEAYKLIESWPTWPSRSINIFGPSGCGKTHLSKIIYKKISSKIIKSSEVNRNLLTNYSNKKCIIIDDFKNNIDENLLYSIINQVYQSDQYIVINSLIPTKNLDIKLKDLKSRIASFTYLGIALPTDDLLRVIITKSFSDKQINVDIKILEYIIKNLDRSYENIFKFIKELDLASLSSGKSININLIKKIINK